MIMSRARPKISFAFSDISPTLSLGSMSLNFSMYCSTFTFYSTSFFAFSSASFICGSNFFSPSSYTCFFYVSGRLS